MLILFLHKAKSSLRPIKSLTGLLNSINLLLQNLHVQHLFHVNKIIAKRLGAKASATTSMAEIIKPLCNEINDIIRY